MKNLALGFLSCGFLLTSISTIYLIGKQEACVYVNTKGVEAIELK
jgi:hypothetical protein